MVAAKVIGAKRSTSGHDPVGHKIAHRPAHDHGKHGQDAHDGDAEDLRPAKIGFQRCREGGEEEDHAENGQE